MRISRGRRSVNESNDLLHHALEYAAGYGWCLIPTKEKRAACQWKHFQNLAPDGRTLTRLFSRPGVDGIALISGPVSNNAACRDFDVEEAYFTWARGRPDLAAILPTVRTARGFHVWHRGPECYLDLSDGEYRGTSKQYTLLPPSRHPSGATYHWIVPLPDGPLPAIDPEAAGLITQGTQATHQRIACVPSAVVDAIEATLPSGPGQRNRQIFDFARRLKGIRDLDASPAALKVYVTEWHRRALPVITTKDFGETWADFHVAWLAVKRPHGTTIKAAYESVIAAEPIDGSVEAGQLAALCRKLRKTDRTFFLSVRMVGELFGLPRMTAWRLLKVLEFNHVIELIRPGSKGGDKREAAEYRYIATDR
jgi:hypothetical protein